MKIIVTGSLGHVSKPLTQQLVQQGHSVTTVTRSADKQAAIEALGAKAAIGSMDDLDFLTATFTGADAVYCMLVPTGGGFSDPNITVADIMVKADQIGHTYLQALIKSGVKRVVYLSSVGAHLSKGNGLLEMHYIVENILSQLPPDVSLAIMRPVGFYDNLLAFINPIKTMGIIGSVYGAGDQAILVSPIDIAAAVAEELTTTAAGRKVRYVASEETTCNEVAATLGEAIGKPDLKWVIISDEPPLAGLKAVGMNDSFAKSFVEMNGIIHNGKVYENYYRHRPTLGKVKVKDFAKEFAAVYN
jgi:uncharacterized protein YbjT (DUF2867 family)